MTSSLRDAPTSCARNLRDQLPRMQTLQESSDRRATTEGVLRVGAEHGGSDVAVAKAAGDVVAVQDGREQAHMRQADECSAPDACISKI